MDRNTGNDALSMPVHDPRTHSTRPTGAMTRSAATRVITH